MVSYASIMASAAGEKAESLGRCRRSASPLDLSLEPIARLPLNVGQSQYSESNALRCSATMRTRFNLRVSWRTKTLMANSDHLRIWGHKSLLDPFAAVMSREGAGDPAPGPGRAVKRDNVAVDA